MQRMKKTKDNRSTYVDWKGIVVDSLYLRDGGICQLCKQSLSNNDYFEIDHIIKRSDGGNDTLMNLRLVHLTCHKARHAKQLTVITEVEELKVPTMNVNFKKLAHIQVLKQLRHGLSKTQNMTKACVLCGITPDQGKYYVGLYRLNWRDHASWNLDKI